MPKILPCRSVLLLLFANLVLIVCPALVLLTSNSSRNVFPAHIERIVHCYGDFGHRPRRERSSYYGPSYARSDRTNVQDSRFDGSPSARLQQQQKESSAAQQAISFRILNERLHRIFAFPDREDMNWINSTFGYTLNDGKTPNPDFTVHRSPDGKLSWIYNEFLPLQTMTERQDSQPTISTPKSTNTPDVVDDDNCRERKQGKTYCVNVPNYAEQTQLHKVTKEELDKFNELFVEDVIEPNDVKIRMKIGDPEDIELCRSKSKVVYPQKGLTKNSEWKFLYQTAEVKQGVLEETCENEGNPCEFSENFPSTYVSRCKQYTSYRLMVAIENGTLSKKEFIVGGACKCVLRAKPSIYSRPPE